MPTTTTAPDPGLLLARDQVAAEIARTDAKAAAMLTAYGIPFAVLVATFPGRDLPALATALAGLGTVGLVAAMVTVLLVIRPRLAVRTEAVTGTFAHWADCTPEEVAADVAVNRYAETIAELSRIARSKYRMLRLAIDITAGALAFLALALFIPVI